MIWHSLLPCGLRSISQLTNKPSSSMSHFNPPSHILEVRSTLKLLLVVEAQVERPRILGWGPKRGGVEFINFPFGSFGSEICSEQWWATTARIRGQIQKGQTGSTRTQESQEPRNLISDPNSWPYDPNMLFPLFFLNIVHKYALYDPIIP